MWHISYRFPYEYVESNSRIIIYGAGKVGKAYVSDISETNYCSILAIADVNFNKYKNYPISVIAPEKISSYEYDFIVVAIKDWYVARDIVEYLVSECDIPRNKIIYQIPIENYGYRVPMYNVDKCDIMLDLDEPVMAICVHPNLGDAIIVKKAIEQLYQVLQKKCKFDIYVIGNNASLVEAIYYDLEYINRIYANTEKCYFRKKYYLAIFSVTYIIKVDFINYDFYSEKHKALYEYLEKIKKYEDSFRYIGAPWQIYGVHFARCKYEGFDMYTTYNRYPGFCVKDYKVNIPIKKEYEKIYQELDICGRYITVNYGWAGRSSNSNKIHAKAWVLANYEILISMIKEKYPDIIVVQTGMSDTPKISNADMYVFGYDIEIVKYVLKNSDLHIDCEGGLVHLATQLGTKCAVMFGPTPVHYFGYKDNINIVAGNCHDCFCLEASAMTCLRNLAVSPCMEVITPELVFSKISDQLRQINI